MEVNSNIFRKNYGGIIMKRVYCLYRVSTKKQVDKNDNDIPMQKTACHEFCESQKDWTILKEFSEKGISGFKVSADERDAIQELKEAALKNEFDILLVFMFDRIGRIDDETPFVVEWFVKHNIEVWSTQEGQQRFDNHTDKLLNYIRFWQASGESQKTSIRIKNSLQQMEEAGLYTGGPVKFGYHLVESGLVNKKNQPIKKYEIDLEESELLRTIDNLTIHSGYGAWRLANYLNEHGYKTKEGGKFTSTKIARILKDPFYCGVLPDGRTSEALQALRIRSDETFAQIQYILKQRSQADQDKRHIALRTQGKAMLSGNLFCAHCGGRLTTTHYKDTYVKRDGTERVTEAVKYACYHKVRKLCECDGQTTYRADIIDGVITEMIHQIFGSMNGSPEEERLQLALKRKIAINKANQQKLKLELKKATEQLEVLDLEVGKALIGESEIGLEQLGRTTKALEARVDEIKSELNELEREELEQVNNAEAIIPAYKRFKSWADEFDNATMEQKKMIACQLFSRIDVGRDYVIHVEMNLTYKQFCSGWNVEGENTIIENDSIDELSS